MSDPAFWIDGADVPLPDLPAIRPHPLSVATTRRRARVPVPANPPGTRVEAADEFTGLLRTLPG